MSYILDALTKAAQQRDRQTPVVQRLLMPAPRARLPWTLSPARLVTALAVSAILPAIVLVWWMAPEAPPDPVPIAAPAPAAPARPARPEPQMPAPAEPTQPARPEPPRMPVRAEPPRPARLDTAKAPAPAPVPVPAEPAKPARIEPPAKPEVPAATRAKPKAPEPASSAPRASVPAPQPPPAQTVSPAVSSSPMPPAERARLKLEALIYSDVPAQRFVFINGRRYVEGDLIDGRLRIEQIQEDGVELSTEGRRFTLRAAR